MHGQWSCQYKNATKDYTLIYNLLQWLTQQCNSLNLLLFVFAANSNKFCKVLIYKFC